MLKNILKKRIYYYVPKCPECGSRVTGRFIKRPKYESDAIYTERECLKHGELITFTEDNLVNNCYCEECGFQWAHHVEGLLISIERIQEEKKARGTAVRLAEFNQEHPKKRKNVLTRMMGVLPKY